MRKTLAVLALAGVLGAGTLANGVPARPNVPTIDRTLVCETALTGGVQKMFALAHAGTGRVGSTWRPRRDSAAALTQLASLTGGKVLSENRVGEIAKAARSAIGQGPTVALRHEGGRSPLMPWITALAFLPLVVVFLRRNLIVRLRRPSRWSRRWRTDLEKAEERPTSVRRPGYDTGRG